MNATFADRLSPLLATLYPSRPPVIHLGRAGAHAQQVGFGVSASYLSQLGRSGSHPPLSRVWER
jgi:hypothetical protein